jgi:hypothetical protein
MCMHSTVRIYPLVYNLVKKMTLSYLIKTIQRVYKTEGMNVKKKLVLEIVY